MPEDKYMQLTAEGFVWDATIRFDYEKFYNELMIYKYGDEELGLKAHGDLLVPYDYVNEKTGYKLGSTVNGIRTYKKALNKWNALSKEEQEKTNKPTKYVLTEDKYMQLTDEGFVWKAPKGLKKKEIITEQGLSA